MEITLTEADLALAQETANKRNAENRRVNRRDGKVLSNSLDIDLQGARSELAVARALNLKWDGAFLADEVWKVWKTTGCDVQNLEVRSTLHQNGRLILHPKDKDEAPYILVIASKHPTYQLVGWCFGREGKIQEYWHDVGYGRPCYFVPRNKLKKIEDLVIKDAPLVNV